MKSLIYSLPAIFQQTIKLIRILVLFLLFTSVCYSQVSERWVHKYNGSGNGNDYLNVVKADNSGNVYVAGQVEQSPGVNISDMITIKYDVNGNILWEKKYVGTGGFRETATGIALDNAGNVYITGYTGDAPYTGSYSALTIKYDALGNQLWERKYNDGVRLYNIPAGIAVDNAGNVYVTGIHGNDPWNNTTHDYLTIKYDNAGNQIWVKTYNGTGNSMDMSNAISVDNTGKVAITGTSTGAGTGYDFATILYDAAGNQVWVKRFNDPVNGKDEGRDVSFDNSGNVCVTGYIMGSGGNNDFATIKYDAAGNELWTKTYNGPANGTEFPPYKLIIDNSNNIIIAGESRNAGGSYDFATVKYNAAGNELWASRYNAGLDGDFRMDAKLDNDGNVYVCGTSKTSGGNYDITTVKFNSSGVQQWVIKYNNLPYANSDVGHALSIDPFGNIFVAGYIYNGGSMYDCVTIKYSQDENTRTFVDLVKIYGAGNCKATFGYKFDHDENIPIGADNRFIPAPEDRGQTTAFTAGTHHDLFEVSFSTPITWHVKNGTVTTEAEAVEKNIYSEVNDYITIMPSLNQETEYEIKYKKTGGVTDVFTDIELYNTIPEGTEFISATSSAKMTAVGLTGNTFKWTRADPIGPANEEDMVKIKVKVTDATKPNYTNTAVLKTKCAGTNYHSYGTDVNGMPPAFPNTWTQYPTGVPYSLFAVDFYKNDLTPAGNDMVGLAVGQGGTVLRTTDAGDEWTLVYQNNNIWLNDVKWATADVAYAAGMGGVIIKTIDAGVTWTVIRAYDTPLHTFRGIAVSQAYDYNFVTFVGYAGTYFETHDAGATFTQRTDVTPWTMHSIDFVYVAATNNLNGIIAGTDGYVWNTTNHGVNWVVRPELRNSGVYDYLNDVVFASKDIAFICGNNGRIVWTTNHGVTWIVKPSFTSQHLRSIDMVKTGPPAYDHRTVTVCGDNGTIYTSLDWCNTWTNGSPAGETRHFYGVCLNGENRGTVVGEIGTGVGNAGMMYNTLSNGIVGVNQIGTTVPTEFKLNQNYPNPFNPMTKISFSLAKSGPVMLSVFDMTGKEVARIVNTVLSAGNFEYTFDGSKHASGIYFYRIVTNDYVETKKMTLIK